MKFMFITEEKTNMDKIIVSAYLEIISREDEKKWKEFLRHYFPNHYASKILDEDLVVENPKEGHISKRIGVSVKGFGWLSGMILHYAPREYHIPVKDFEDFKKTDIYKEIVANGPTFEVGSPQCVPLILK